MMKQHEIEVTSKEKEHAIDFLKKQGYTVACNYIGEKWFSSDVYKITWYADDLNNHFTDLLYHLQNKRNQKK